MVQKLEQKQRKIANLFKLSGCTQGFRCAL